MIVKESEAAELGDLKPELVLLQTMPEGREVSEPRPNGAVAKVDFDLNSFIGSYEFFTPDDAGNKTASIELVDGKLQWRFAGTKGTLVSTGTGYTTDAKGQKEKDLRNFKFAENPDIRVQFTIINGRVDEVTFYNSSLSGTSARLGAKVR